MKTVNYYDLDVEELFHIATINKKDKSISSLPFLRATLSSIVFSLVKISLNFLEILL